LSSIVVAYRSRLVICWPPSLHVRPRCRSVSAVNSIGYPVPLPDQAEMLNGPGYCNRIFHCQFNSIAAWMS